MGRPITDEYFASSSTIWNNVARLHYIEKKEETGLFDRAIRHLSKFGFRRYFYISSDDSKHFKRNHHVLIMSTFDGCDTEDWASANFVLPT